MIGHLVYGVAMVAISFGGAAIFTHYAFKAVERWCPPDEPVEYVPVDVSAFRLARLRRSTVERYHGRHPFDQEIE